jgi:hypothetical protein
LSVDEIKAEKIEIAENLFRIDLTVLERGQQSLRLKELKEVKNPETKQGGKGGTNKFNLPNNLKSAESALMPSFATETAKENQNEIISPVKSFATEILNNSCIVLLQFYYSFTTAKAIRFPYKSIGASSSASNRYKSGSFRNRSTSSSNSRAARASASIRAGSFSSSARCQISTCCQKSASGSNGAASSTSSRPKISIKRFSSKSSLINFHNEQPRSLSLALATAKRRRSLGAVF